MVKANDDVKAARERYAAALLHCAALKIPYVSIARAVHKSEAAVRMFIMRNELNERKDA